MYENLQTSSSVSTYRGDFIYDKLILVFPDDSDAGSRPNYIVDYGSNTLYPYPGTLHVFNHLISEPTSPNSHTTDALVAYSQGPVNGLAIRNVGSQTIGGISSGNNPDDWS